MSVDIIKQELEKQFQLCHLTKINIRHIHAPEDIEIITAAIGDNINAIPFGQIVAAFQCGGKTYKCYYNIHTPKQPAKLANRMVDIQEIEIKTINIKDEPHAFLQTSDTDFGLRAFWKNTPDRTLTENDAILRQLMHALKQYSVSHKLCAKLRKLDTAWLEKQKG